MLLIIIDAGKYSYASELPFIRENLEKDPQRNTLLKCEVGMPTMTTQRISSMMTGSEVFSTATDMVDAFFSSRVRMDNILSQLRLHNKSTTIMGDGTWVNLFDFDEEFSCADNYDIWDWDTCDDLIYQHLPSSLHHQLVVAHFLALDHIGHATSSLIAPQMSEKKEKISRFINETMQVLPQDMVLIVTGDHGMRDDGNHGGSSAQETETFMFIHSHYAISNRTLRQTDLTSTLALLLDVPIPTNSIGIPFIFENAS